MKEILRKDKTKIERSIEKIYNLRKENNDLKQIKEHTCTKKFCYPKNLIECGMTKEEIQEFDYNKYVYLCKYLHVHICDSYCKGDMHDPISHTKSCSISGENKVEYCHEESIDIGSSNVGSLISNMMIGKEATINIDCNPGTGRSELISLQRDTYYNEKNYSFINDIIKRRENELSEINKVNLNVKKLKKREKKIISKSSKNDKFIPSNDDIIKICLLLKPIGIIHGIPVYLLSYSLLNYFLTNLVNISYNSDSDSFYLSTSDVFNLSIGTYGRIKDTLNEFKKNKPKLNPNFYTYESVVNTAEEVLIKLLPSINRIKDNFLIIQSNQKLLYAKIIQYIDNCIINKKIINKFNLLNLSFDKTWNGNELINWVTKEQWDYYIGIILRSYILCENCGDNENNNIKCLNPLRHILAMMYLLQEGYTVVTNSVEEIVIPKDIYLNTFGVLLEKNKLTNIDKKARKILSDGIKKLKNILNFILTIMPATDIRKLIFGDI